MEMPESYVQVVLDAPPSGDLIFMPVNSAGSPGTLNRAVLAKLGLPTRSMPPAAQLRPGFAYVIIAEGRQLCFIVTVNVEGRKEGTAILLTRNLGNALHSKVAADAQSLWLPLMGMGAGGLSAVASLEATLLALAPLLRTRSTPIKVTIAPPLETDSREFARLKRMADDFTVQLQLPTAIPEQFEKYFSPQNLSDAAESAVEVSAAGFSSRKQASAANDVLAIAVDEDGDLDSLIGHLQQSPIGHSPWGSKFLGSLQSLRAEHNSNRMLTAMSGLAEFVTRFSFCNPDRIYRRSAPRLTAP